LRRKKNHQCIGCKRELQHRRDKRPDVAAKIQAHRRDLREMGRAAAVIQDQKMRAIRIKATELASQRWQDVSRWQDCWNEAREIIG
jgi:hypothetical protein